MGVFRQYFVGLGKEHCQYAKLRRLCFRLKKLHAYLELKGCLMEFHGFHLLNCLHQVSDVWRCYRQYPCPMTRSSFLIRAPYHRSHPTMLRRNEFFRYRNELSEKKWFKSMNEQK